MSILAGAVVSQNLTILLVEDNPGDVYLFKAALSDLSADVDLSVFDNGLHAWRFLEEVAGGKAAAPDLIILDLNLPGMGGREILEGMTNRAELHEIPVCIFTGAGSEEGIVAEHPPLRLCFYAKVDSFNRLREIIKNFIAFARQSARP